MSFTLGPATSESSLYATIRRLCKTDPINPDYYTSDAIICAYSNEELQLLASECRSIKISNVNNPIITVQGQRTYNLPNDCLEVVDCYLGATGAQIRMQEASTEFCYQTFGPSFTIRQGQPFYYYIDYDSTNNIYQIAFAMVPSVSGQPITMFYILRPADLVVGNDGGVPQIDNRLDWALAYGVAARIMHDKRDPAFEQLYSQKRQEIVMKYNDSGRKSRQPLAMLNTSRANPTYEI